MAIATDSLEVNQYTSSGTWTKPSGASWVEIYILGAGGGGQSGCVKGTGVQALGGTGGGGGGLNIAQYAASDLPSSLTVTIGTGGSGGAITTSATNNNGVNGGTTSVSNGSDTYLSTVGGSGVGAAGAGRYQGWKGGIPGGGSSANGQSPQGTNQDSTVAAWFNGGGCSGAGVRTTNATGTGGTNAGAASPANGYSSGDGGQGGNSSTTVDGTTGTAGVLAGAGGGGGGSTRTGHTAGGGGTGSNGLVLIVTWK